jgi:hypothetical protein
VWQRSISEKPGFWATNYAIGQSIRSGSIEISVSIERNFCRGGFANNIGQQSTISKTRPHPTCNFNVPNRPIERDCMNLGFVLWILAIEPCILKEVDGGLSLGGGGFMRRSI